jgi:short-subunit dehydrogenase
VPTALVTGASAGLGRAFCDRLAADGYDLVVVSRDATRLQVLADDLSASAGVDVQVLPADLTHRADLQRVADRVAHPQQPVDLLVNNAGNALRKPFAVNDAADEEAMLDLHVRATLVLTHAAVRAMGERGHGEVVNVASVAGWLPVGSYSAHKAWVTVFSQAVAQQVASRGVRVMALNPGFVRTEFHERAQMDMSRLPDAAWLSAPDVVDEALSALRRGRLVFVPSRRYQAVAALLRNAPHETVFRVRSRLGR